MTEHRVLICGDRNWSRPEPIRTVLRTFPEGTVVIHGDAKGADKMAAAIARGMGFKVEAFPADWRGHGRGAGPIRNKLMLTEGKPTVVHAFKQHFDFSFASGGTENMVKIAREAGIPAFVHHF